MKRVIFSDNGTLNDFSVSLNKYDSTYKTVNLAAAQDAIYISSKMPFNHIYIKLLIPNTNNTSMSVSYWTSNSWEPVVELIDETDGFKQSGFVTFTPSKNAIWTRSSTSSDGSEIDGLENIVIYDQYWIKITFSNNLSSDTSLTWVGNIFSNDDDLACEFPDFSKQSVKTSAKPGKVDWEEQHVKAASILAQDLIDKGIIYETGQVLNKEDYREASVMKCAEIIYRMLGDDFADQRREAREEYQHRLAKRLHAVDTNMDAIEQVSERKQETGFMTR